MKKLFLILLGILAVQNVSIAQDTYSEQMQTNVSKLDIAKSVGDYQALANDFLRLAEYKKTDWLSYYYAAYCNTKIGWLDMQSPDKITPFANVADEQIKNALTLLDTNKMKNDLSEVYCVRSMIYRAKVYINPMTNGKKYGPAANQYSKRANQLNPENPRAIYLLGWEKYNTPKLWGGDKDKAKEYFQSAGNFFSKENKSSNLKPHWGERDNQDILAKYDKQK